MKKLLGYAAVDSGQLMITDPCYINSEWENIDYDPNSKKKAKPNTFSYAGICETTLFESNTRDKHQINFKKGHKGCAIVFSSGYGDGIYPVYGTFNKEGRCVKVEIDCNLTDIQKKFIKGLK